ncbi:MAG: AAA family ATPase [Eubacteriales bacterium]
MKSKAIAYALQKGGVGKTSSCASVAVGLAMEGKKVLMVDCDPQGSLAIAFGIDNPDRLDVSLVG